jgi:small subunit ribosomal protein S36
MNTPKVAEARPASSSFDSIDHAEVPQRSPFWSRVRSIPRIVWLIILLNACLLFGYSVLFPLYRAPDEHGHVDMILQVREEFSYPDYNEAFYSDRIIESLSLVHFDRGSQHLLAEEALPRSARPSFSEIPAQSDLTDTPNLLGTHPPLYYGLLAAISSFIGSLTPGDAWSFDAVVGMLRLLNIFMIAFLPLLAFITVRRFQWPFPVAIGAALVPLAIPQLANIGSSVNNDNLLTLLTSLVTVLLVRVSTGDSSMRTAVWLGVLGGLALFTKGFALAVPLWLGAGYLVAIRSKAPARLALRRLGVALVLSTLLGGWWWIRNVVLFGSLRTGTELDPRPLAAPGFEADTVWWLGRYLSWMMDRFWGSFGRVDIILDWNIVVAATAILLGAIAFAFIGGAKPWTRWHILLLLFPFLTTLALVTGGAYESYLRLGQPLGFHGRYLFPGIVGLAAVVALGLGHLLRRWRRFLPLVLFIAAAAIHLASVRLTMPLYWGSVNASLGDRFEALLAWSPWPSWLVVGIGIIGILSALAVVVGLVRMAISEGNRRAPVRTAAEPLTE